MASVIKQQLKIFLFCLSVFGLFFAWTKVKEAIQNYSDWPDEYLSRETVKPYVRQIRLGNSRQGPTGKVDKSVEIYTPPEGEIEITPKDPNKKITEVVNIKRKICGLTFRPGLQGSIAPLGLGLDFKLAYASRFGLNGGGLWLTRERLLTPSLGLSYRLDATKFLYNTEWFVSYTPLSPFFVATGVRINL